MAQQTTDKDETKSLKSRSSLDSIDWKPSKSLSFASQKRDNDFHSMFKSIPSGEHLVECKLL